MEVFITFALIGLGVWRLVAWLKNRAEDRELNEDGLTQRDRVLNMARWDAEREWAELNKHGLINETGIFVGYSQKGRYRLLYNGDRHIITFGPIGSGKGATAQIPALLHNSDDSECSALVIDVKGQLAAVTAQVRAQRGQAVYCINPFDVLSIPSATYNPLRFVDPASVSFASDCKRIAEGLGFEGADNTENKNAFFEITALDLVNVIIQWAVVYAGKEGWEEYEPNLITVRKILNQGEPHRSDFFRALTGVKNEAIAEGAQMFVAPESGQVRGAIEDCFATARGKLSFLRDPGIERVLRGGKNEISFADLKRKRMTVYLIIPPELLGTHGRFLRLLVMSALNELFRERTQPKNPVLFMLDEFAQLGYMSLIENVASVGRDYKIRLWCILQNIPQLKNLYGSRWESFLSAAGVAQFFTPNDVETAAWMSKRAGNKVIQRTTRNTSTTTGSSTKTGSAQSDSESTTTGISVSWDEEPALKQEAILGLAANQEILFLPNHSVHHFGSRRPYFEDDTLEPLRPWIVKDPYHMADGEFETFKASLPGSCLDPERTGPPRKITPTLGA